MSRVIGVDIQAHVVRLVVVRARYRSLEIEAFAEQSLERAEDAGAEGRSISVTLALKSALGALGERGTKIDTVVASVPTLSSFVQRVSFPKSAEKRVEQLLPFELESELPVDIDEVTFGYRPLESSAGEGGIVQYLAICARAELVRERIAVVREALGHEPERIGVAAAELGQLIEIWPTLGLAEPAAILDLGLNTTDVCVISRGQVRMIRGLRVGAAAFPGGAEPLVSQLRQTLNAHALTPGEAPVQTLYVCGEGSRSSGILDYLSERLEVRAAFLPAEGLGNLSTSDQDVLPVYALALGAAVHGARQRGFDLRRGELSFSRGFAFVKERAPVLSALGFAIFLSFLFATWAEGRALESEAAMLRLSLGELTQATFNEKTEDPDEAETLMQRALKNNPEDPMPYMDGFGAAVALSETLPDDIVHDVEQFEFTKGKLKIRGLVSSTEEAQRVAKALEQNQCIREPKISKITQVVNSERERYILEADVRCPLDRQAASETIKPKAVEKEVDE